MLISIYYAMLPRCRYAVSITLPRHATLSPLTPCCHFSDIVVMPPRHTNAYACRMRHATACRHFDYFDGCRHAFALMLIRRHVSFLFIFATPMQILCGAFLMTPATSPIYDDIYFRRRYRALPLLVSYAIRYCRLAPCYMPAAISFADADAASLSLDAADCQTRRRLLFLFTPPLHRLTHTLDTPPFR